MTDTEHLRRTLERASAAGFYGFSGLCGQAAVAINRSLLAGRGTIVGAFNAAFYARGRAIGHVAVQVGDAYWDSDARAKGVDDVTAWGMLDPDDPDYAEAAARLGIAWDDAAAEAVTFVILTEAEALALWGSDSLEGLLEDLAHAALDPA